MLTNLHVLTLDSPKALIILAISSRIYVEAAVKIGFKVIAIDAFADADTRRLAAESFKVDFANGQLDAQQILNIAATLDLSKVIGICYGAGLESQTDLLLELEKNLPVLGNSATTVKYCKAPETFFLACQSLHIPTPETRLTLPENPAGWLQKMVGGSGGAHIAAADKSAQHDSQLVYYQKYQPGICFSCLFLANIDFVQIIGFNEQWVDGNSLGDFCYGGAVNHADIDIKEYVIDCIKKLSQHFALKGLNSCDFLYHENAIYMLEINPRLSASLDLYENQQAALLQAHIDIFKNDARTLVKLPLSSCKAHQVVYAQADMVINKDAWPGWVSDIPDLNAKITKGAPICTVSAAAVNAKSAKALLKQRVATLYF